MAALRVMAPNIMYIMPANRGYMTGLSTKVPPAEPWCWVLLYTENATAKAAKDRAGSGSQPDAMLQRLRLQDSIARMAQAEYDSLM